MTARESSYLAFDLGASSGRAVVGTLREGRMDLEVVRRFDTPVVREGTSIRWDIDAMWSEMDGALRSAAARLPRLRSVSVDSWGVDYVAVDEHGQQIGLPFCYRDTRTDGILEAVESRVGADALYRATGIQSLPFNTLFQLVADRRAGRRAVSHLTMADWFNHRLGGEAVIEVSLASTTQMMRAGATRAWAVDVMAALDLDASAWPRIVPSGSVVGRCPDHPEIAVVASCSHDTGAAVAAVPATGTSGSWCFVSCGTWSLMGVELGEPVLTRAAREAGFTNEAGVDGSVRFLRNLTGLWVLQECVREWGDVADWSTLEREATEAGPAPAVVDLEHPRFIPRGGMQDRLEATLREADDPVPTTRGAWARLILESIADSYRRALDDLVRLTGCPVDTVHLVGGGSQNALLCQLAADACRARVVAGPAEATALGNLLIQARAMGDLPEGESIRDVSARTSTCTIFEPTHSREANASA